MSFKTSLPNQVLKIQSLKAEEEVLMITFPLLYLIMGPEKSALPQLHDGLESIRVVRKTYERSVANRNKITTVTVHVQFALFKGSVEISYLWLLPSLA